MLQKPPRQISHRPEEEDASRKKPAEVSQANVKGAPRKKGRGDEEEGKQVGDCWY